MAQYFSLNNKLKKMNTLTKYFLPKAESFNEYWWTLKCSLNSADFSCGKYPGILYANENKENMETMTACN